MRLEGRTALITGAGSGIGRALAIEASRRAMTVALVGRRADKLEETRASLDRRAGCLVIPTDVTRPDARRAIYDRVLREWGRLHVLVNNAGIISAGPLVHERDSDLEALMATNVVAPLALARLMLPLLRASAPSRIVNIGSIFGDIGFPLFAAYSASKFGLRGLSNALRRELKVLGVGVTYAAPRGARTAATQAVEPYLDSFEVSLDEPEAIARRVWDAVIRDADSAYPPGRERLFVLVERLFPSLVSRSLESQLASGGGRKLIEDATPV